MVGRERLVLDLSCRRKADGRYYVVTDRWQRFSELAVDESTLADLGETLASTCKLGSYSSSTLVTCPSSTAFKTA